MGLVIGAPVYNRGWVLPRWFDCIMNQDLDLSEVSLVFAYTEGDDDTYSIIEEYAPNFKAVHILDCNDVPAFSNRDNERFFSLVILRNRIIFKIRELQPEYFFSYDTDILIPGGAIKTLIEDDKDIVAPYCDLVPPKGVPNCSSFEKGLGFFRRKPYTKYYPLDSLFKVESVFAVQLISKKVYDTCTYKWHSGGEDYGFSLEVMKHGFESWMDSRIVCTHLYNK